MHWTCSRPAASCRGPTPWSASRWPATTWPPSWQTRRRRNTLAARFSIPFAVATRLVNGNSGVRSFGWEAVRDARVLALAQRVQVREDPAMTRRLPQERPARVTVHGRDGRRVVAEVASNRGDEAAPYTEQELRAKFEDLCACAWPRSHAQAVLAATLDLGRGTAMADWLPLLLQSPAN